MRATPVGIAFRPGQALADAAWRSCVVTHNTVQGIEATTLVAAAVSFAIEGERDFLHLAVEFVRKLHSVAIGRQRLRCLRVCNIS